MKKALLSFMFLFCCAVASQASSFTVINSTGCNFDLSFGLNNPLAVSGTVTVPPGTTTYSDPSFIPATWAPALTPAQLASATFMYLYAAPVSSPTTTFLLRAGNSYNSAAAGFFPACQSAGFAATWNVNATNVVVLIF